MWEVGYGWYWYPASFRIRFDFGKPIREFHAMCLDLLLIYVYLNSFLVLVK